MSGSSTTVPDRLVDVVTGGTPEPTRSQSPDIQHPGISRTTNKTHLADDNPSTSTPTIASASIEYVPPTYSQRHSSHEHHFNHESLLVEDTKPSGSAKAIIAGSVFVGATCAALYVLLQPYSLLSILTTTFLWAAIACLVWHSLGHHQHAVFGQANSITLIRAASTASLAGFIPIAADITSPGTLWAIALVATITLCMDGLDGYLARKTRLSSEFGARFDMETDALLALIITLFLWQSDKLGIWVMGLGLMRYAFLTAAIWWAPLQGELYPSLRRKTICVVQVGALCLMLCPLLSSYQATVVGALALMSLAYSFAVDITWLFRQHGKGISGS